MLRLFLDGAWCSITIDDRLPVTDQPRRAELAFDSKLAFSRCGGSNGGGQQLWTSLLEKTYAKAHGSYSAISGGEIAEALLDLTGAPTETIILGAQEDLELLWQRLREFRRHKLPMGCGTAGGHSELREVGLCSSHAYSIIDVREIRLRARDGPFTGSGYVLGGAGISSGGGAGTLTQRSTASMPSGSSGETAV